MSPSPASPFAIRLFAGLVARGLTDVVIAPGARSQALALAALELEQRGLVTVHVRIDERVAAFVALGIGLETRRPAAVITTSGSAVANLHPAVLEAHHAGVPLILLTADRPDELHGIGSNQTTAQAGLFGSALRLTIDEPAPTSETPDARAEELAAQNGRFTLVTRSVEGDQFEVIDSIVRAEDGNNTQVFVDAITDPATAIVTLTITEAGYGMDANGHVDTVNPPASLHRLAVALDLGQRGAGLLLGQ